MKGLSKDSATWLEVGEEGEAQRVDNYLVRLLKGVPKSHVYRILRSGEVRVNSGRVGPDYRLKLGDRVRVPPIRTSSTEHQAKPAEFPVVHEDPALLVLDKPAGVAVHGGSGVSFGVIESLRAARPQTKLLELAHRLDRDTSGLLMIAKKRSALVELHRMLRHGEVEKVYLALAKGRPVKPRFDISEALHKHVTAQGERRVSVTGEGRASLTRVKVLKGGHDYSLLELRLLTGRTHQIRVHLAHVGHPVLGDGKYGDFEFNRKIGAKRLFLHASRLALRHPLSGEMLKLQSPLPSEMEDFVKRNLG